MRSAVGVDVVAVLRARGLRATRQRVAVLGVLIERPHSDTDTVLRLVRERGVALSPQAGYDVLAALTGAGAARRIEPAGSPARFEARVADQHHHVVCRVCGHIEDVDCTVGPAPCLDPEQTHGFALDEAEVTFWGICPGCRIASQQRAKEER